MPWQHICNCLTIFKHPFTLGWSLFLKRYLMQVNNRILNREPRDLPPIMLTLNLGRTVVGHDTFQRVFPALKEANTWMPSSQNLDHPALLPVPTDGLCQVQLILYCFSSKFIFLRTSWIQAQITFNIIMFWIIFWIYSKFCFSDTHTHNQKIYIFKVCRELHFTN